MSFPRAKIQRFNDIKAYTPSPAEYNVTVKEKAKGSVIGQTERFIEQSPTRSDNGSVHSTPCFRTPQKPSIVKKKCPTSDVKPKTKTKDLFLNQKDLELLKEKTVECENKDSYIKDLTEHLECMKNKIANLEKEKCNIESEKITFKKQIDLLKYEENISINKLKLVHETELQNIKTQVLQALEELSTLKQEYNELNAYYKQEIKNLQGSEIKLENMRTILETKNDEISNKDREIALLKESWRQIQNKQEHEFEHLTRAHKEEFELLKQIILQGLYNREQHLNEMINENYTFVKEICSCIKTEYDTLELEFDRKLKEEIENQKLEHENQIKEEIKKVESTLSKKLKEQEEQHDQILKECQAISEYNIIQTEVEKNDVKKKLVDKETQYNNLSSQYENLSGKYDQLVQAYKKLEDETSKRISELHTNNNEICDDIKRKEHLITNLLSEKHTYEITIHKCQETIQVLTKRLINSDKDVEQLKNEIHSCETKILNYEEKCIQLNSELEGLKMTIDELEMQTESTVKLTESDIMNVKENLLEKLEHFKLITETRITDLQDQLLKRGTENETLQKQLQQHQKVTSDCQLLVNRVENRLECLESENSFLKSENEKLTKVSTEFCQKLSSYDQMCHKNEDLQQKLVTVLDKNTSLSKSLEQVEDEASRVKKQLQQIQEKSDVVSQYCDYYKRKVEEYENEIEDAAEIRKKYIDQSGKYDDLLQKFEQLQKQNSLLTKMITEQNSLIGPFRDQLEKYELEKKALMSEKDYIENEAHEMGMKYAEILGHQNHKQKIKHLINLKLKNEELTKDKLELESKVRIQSKQIEKMRKENVDLKKSMKKTHSVTADKENFISPNVSLNSSKLDSPGPLRERN